MSVTQRRFTYGTLTSANKAEVAEAIRSLFIGPGIRYALASIHSDLMPSLRTGQVMDEIGVSDWGVTMHDSFMLDAQINEGYDATFSAAYVRINWNKGQVEFQQRNPNGSISHLILAREPSDEEVFA